MRRVHPAVIVTLVISSVLVIVGAVVVAVSNSTPTTVGWFAYQPMAGSLLLPDGVLLTGPAIAGAVGVVLGLVGLAGVAGFALGRRRSAGG
ncbi:hypothetical protein MUN74_09440 [Agromyces endophyticus]|uniref:hypothetical protein n=1 Tax=Agromyces sp. H17E-10 TaxID=2932244 RepID=UPI001FD0DC67|nr:hypothetical protein [Agromyces sp. H17E-10]UOQ91091.1 hypothetical protein MUN74_09440 [Agromyces sp. H17E-10]